MTMTREEFEAAFDARTLAYLPGFQHATDPLVIVVGEAAHTPAGHCLLVTLSNLVARAHRRLVYVGDLEKQLLCPDVFDARTLASATAGLALSINPSIDVDVAASMPGRQLLSIGIGVKEEPRVDLELGCDGWLAILEADASVGEDRTSIWGALLAAVLGANAAFHSILGGGDARPGTFSLWDYVRRGGRQGPVVSDPVDIGRVLQVGAGAVGSGLDYFLGMTGVAGSWCIVDGDDVDVTNLNRQMMFVAKDAGFPNGKPLNKAKQAAKRLDANIDYSDRWYGDDPAFVDRQYDVVLALANDHGVRSFLQGRQPTVLLHATTSPNWQAQLHRHVAGRDDCIDCRLPSPAAAFVCSTEEVEGAGGQRFDAAVPPLSSLAGLLLGAELVKLQHGTLLDEPQAPRLVACAGLHARDVRYPCSHCQPRLAPDNEPGALRPLGHRRHRLSLASRRLLRGGQHALVDRRCRQQ